MVFNNKNYFDANLNVISWNIEDFVETNSILKDFNLMKLLKEQQIILIQEWKENQNSKNFLNKLNEGNYKFSYIFTDRVAIIYDNTFFYDKFSEGKNNRLNEFTKLEPLKYEIPLVHEEPVGLEKIYTSGRPKSSILGVFYPRIRKQKPVVVISLHLNAYTPSRHTGFHSKQLVNLIKDARLKIEEIGIIDYDIIIGGDTNYRIAKSKKNIIKSFKSITNLKKSLLDDSKEISTLNLKTKNLIARLTNSCNKFCKEETTHSFRCVHEKKVDKILIKKFSDLFDESRLDIILTNLQVINTQVLPECKMSDHKIISTKLKFIF